METKNLEWLVFNALHGDINGDIPEDLQAMIKAEQEFNALRAELAALKEAVARERERLRDVIRFVYEECDWEPTHHESGGDARIGEACRNALAALAEEE